LRQANGSDDRRVINPPHPADHSKINARDDEDKDLATRSPPLLTAKILDRIEWKIVYLYFRKLS
jgi:hypothetical protein